MASTASRTARNRRNFFYNLGLNTKIYGGFGLLLCFTIGFLVFVIYELNKMVGKFDAYREKSTAASEVKIVQKDLLTARMEALKFRVEGNPERIESFNAAVEDLFSRKEKISGFLASTPVATNFEEARSLIQRYQQGFDEIVTLQEERDRLVNGTLNALGTEMRKQLSDVMSSAYRDGDREAAFYGGIAQQHLMLARYYASKFLVDNDMPSAERVLQELGTARNSLTTLLSRLENFQRRRTTQDVLQKLGSFDETFNRIVEVINQRNGIQTGRLDRLGPQFVNLIDEVIAYVGTQQQTAANAHAAVADEMFYWVLIVGMIGLLIAVGTSYFLSRIIVVPIQVLTRNFEHMANGQTDFTIREQNRDDEIGRMFNTLRSLRDTVTKAFAQAQMIDELPVPIMVADPHNEFRISYANKAAIELAKDLEQYFDIKADAVVGTSIDKFHKNPGHQHKILSEASNLPWTAKITVGEDDIELRISPICDTDGKYLSAMLQWNVVTVRERLSRDFDRDVKGAVSNLDRGFQTLLAAMDEVATVAERNLEQSATVAAATEEATSNVQTVAAATEQLSASTVEISERVAGSTETLNSALEDTRYAANTANELADASSRIGEVVRLIADIAEQTNLLALNATIEAARAGAHGKGFAVVAAEVKTLAQQTASATNQVETEISSVQSSVTTLVEAVKKVTDNMDEVSAIFTNVAAAVEEQQTSTGEISRSASEVASGTQEVSSSFQTVRQGSDETGRKIKDIRENLNELVEVSEGLGTAADDFLKRIASS